MSGFNLKPKNTGGGSSDVDFAAIAEQVEEGLNVAVISGIIDLGLQERGQGIRETDKNNKQVFTLFDDEDDAEDFVDLVKELSNKDVEVEEVEDGFRVLGEVYDKKPAQEIAIFADLPDTLVDYGDGEEKPYRLLLNPSFRGELRGFPLAAVPPKKKGGLWTFASNSLLYKLAKHTDTKEIIEEGEDNMNVGLLLGKPFMVTVEKSGSFINQKGTAPLMKNMSVTDLPYEPVGISFDNVTTELLDQFKVRASILKKIKESIWYSDEELGKKMRKAVKGYEALVKSRQDSKSNDDDNFDEDDEEDQPKQKKTTKKSSSKATSSKKGKTTKAAPKKNVVEEDDEQPDGFEDLDDFDEEESDDFDEDSSPF